MGGPCDAEITGATPEEVIQNAGKHVMETHDEAHEKIAADMQAMTPEQNEEWTAKETARLSALATETPAEEAPAAPAEETPAL